MDSIEDIYEASYGQEGLLYESIAAGAGALYVEQFVFSLAGRLDEGALRDAWGRLAERHEVLRTCFPWQAADRPIQVVSRDVEIPWSQLDWSDIPEADRRARLTTFARDEAQRGFDLERPPLWRVALIRADEDAHWMVWTFHHVLLDGWCLPPLFRELDQHYQAIVRGGDDIRPRPRPYRDYVRWQRSLDLRPVEAFWRSELAGLRRPPAVADALGPGATDPAQNREVELRLPLDLSESIHSLARRHRLTTSTLLLGLWSLLLARHLDEPEVVVGVAVSGRPAELRGVEDMIGMFVGLVPARVPIAGERPLLAWLAELQASQQAREQHAVAGLRNIQQWSELPRRDAIFDTLFAYENYPGSEQAPAGLDGGRLRVALLSMTERTSYPLQLLVAPGPSLGLRLAFDPARLDAAVVAGLSQQLLGLCERAVRSPAPSLGDLLALDEPVRPRSPDPHRAPRPAAAAAPARRADLEPRLAQIWAEALGRDAVGVDDDFISLGGDSIIAIQIVSRARRAGLELTPRDLFEHPTVARLAAVVGHAPARTDAADDATDDIPLTPIQRWFLAQPGEPGHFNQAIAVRLAPGVDPERLRRALHAVFEHHDALRLRFVRDGDGWHQRPGPRLAGPADVPLIARDLADLAPDAARAAIAASARASQASLDLGRGPLTRIGLFTRGPDEPCVLVWIAHHLIVDAVSWRVLLDDLETAHRQLLTGHPIELLPVRTSLRRWSAALAERAHAQDLAGARDFWRAQVAPSALIPQDGPAPDAPDLVADQDEVVARLDPDTTRALLHRAAAAYHTEIGDLLLTALARALRDATGSDVVRLDLEGHGREVLGPQLDVSRTVGWFTTLFPLRLELKGRDPGADILAVKEAVRRLPARGLDFGPLAWLRPDSDLAAAPRAQVCFNYLGQLDGGVTTALLRGFADVDLGPLHAPSRPRAHAITLDSFVADGALQVRGAFGRHQLRRETVAALVDRFLAALRDLVAHCLTPAAFGRSPSDFPAATLTQPDLDHLLARLPDPSDLEDIYDLAPLQKGLLFEALYAPRSGANIEQFHFSLRGELARDRFEDAWARVIARHEALRSSFHWERLAEPVQVVHRRARPAWRELDWRDLPDDRRAAALAEFLAADRCAEFALDRAPLCRFALIRTADERHEFVWTFHHITLDGWGLPLVLTELLANYEAAEGRAPDLPPAPRYRSFIAWCRAQDPAASERFWRGYLAGCTDATRLVLPRPASAPAAERATHQFRLAADLSAGLRELARSWQVTVYIALQGLWALLLHRHAGAPADVLFGAAVSGRPPELPNVERIVGLFVSTIPVRVRIAGDLAVRDWLARMQDEQRERERHAFRALPEIHGWSDVPRGRPLFESLMVYENYPVDEVLRTRDHLGATRVESIRGIEQISCPLTAIFEPGAQLGVRLMYDATRFAAADIERLAVDLEDLARDLVAAPDRRLGELAARRFDRSAAPATAAPLAADDAWQPVHLQFARQAARAPEALALTAGDVRRTYGELARDAARVAAELRRRGVRPEEPVALFCDRTPAWIAAMLGALYAGAAFVPIAATTPDERARRLLDTCGVRLVLTERRHRDRLGDARAVVCVDDLLAGPDDAPAPAPADLGPAQLAYVLFTSGSTGAPKGVAVEHGGLANLVAWHRRRFAVLPGDRASQLASVAFDASVWEVWPYLAAGASLHLVPDGLLLEPAGLRDFLCDRDISLAFVPTALVGALLALPWPARPALRALLTGGDKLHQPPPPGLPFALVNNYGPTETTVVATSTVVPPGGAGAPSIGAAIDGAFVRILDPDLRPVAPGQAGELCVGGRGLARGYFGRPDLTAERFVDDPLGAGRLYRTGDLVRARGDDLEFLGRIDDQISLRGYRIEPGEVEAALTQHPAVQDAVVVARGDGHARALVAYVRLADARAGDEHHEQWQQLFDTTYAAGQPTDQGFNTSGWHSNYTGAAIPPDEMAAWVDAAVDAITRLRPRRVLEIGCGTGLLVARLAPGCEVYRATDYSRAAIEQVEALRRRTPALAHLELAQQPADDLRGCPDGGFDLVVLNSVVQYFADADYLLRVLRGAARVVAPGGHVFVGDVRNHALLAAFHASVALHRAPAALTRDDLRRWIDRRIAAERELLVDPDLFRALVGRLDHLAGARVELQRGAFHNEMTRFRYHATLRVGPPPAAAPPAPLVLEWDRDLADLDALRLRLADLGDRPLVVRGAPNRRLAAETTTLRWLAGDGPWATLGELRDALADPARLTGVDPEDLWRLAEGAGRRAHLSWSTRGPDAIDAAFTPAGGDPPDLGPALDASRPWSDYTNRVQVGASERATLRDLEAHARRLLPAYMVPSAIVAVERWPVTANGKIDRAALPDPAPRKAPAAASLNTATERTLAAIWSEVLGVEILDPQTDFFGAGGHSLSATQVVSRLLEATGVRVPVRMVFEKPTIAALAAYIDALAWVVAPDAADPDLEVFTL
jgi:amino acid adenylation domain-containing protein/non-ribosomal peptide synthase protein (TIGR01720 family)